MKAKRCLCIGEVLWDALPSGLFLGGAVFNVAAHLKRLGFDALFSSRVGTDRLGGEIGRRMESLDLTTGLLQRDAALETGFVEVAVDADGIPSYEICAPAAWDAIALTASLREAAQGSVLIFGSLAQRDVRSRTTIQQLWEQASLRVFDVNLRPPFVDRAIVEDSLRAADVVKMNENEMAVIGQWHCMDREFSDAVAELAETFEIKTVCVTKGERGAALWDGGAWCDHPGHRVEVEDTVGAGDAFLAALVAGQLEDRSAADTLDRANRLGALVASRRGATPAYAVEEIGQVAA